MRAAVALVMGATDGVLGRFVDVAGGLIGDVAAIPVVRLAALGISVGIGMIWLATAWWAMVDLRQRTAGPATPYLAAAAVILATPLLFPLALLVYSVVRPPRTVADLRRLALEDELDRLDAQGFVSMRCPTCAAPAEEGWLRCPNCRARLGYACGSCGRAMGPDWVVCAWCAAEVGASAPADRRVAMVGKRRAAG